MFKTNEIFLLIETHLHNFSPDGFCLVGGGKQLAQLSSDPKFPIAPRPFSIAKLTIVLNMTSRWFSVTRFDYNGA